MSSKKPYDERTDLEKIRSQWTKLRGLHDREEWSASIIRAATAAEISANFLVRTELVERGELDPEFVNSLLKWANGIRGKMDNIVIKLPLGTQRIKELKDLKKIAEKINDKRNNVAHSGHFATREEAEDIEAMARTFILGLVLPYQPDFELKQLESASFSEREHPHEVTKRKPRRGSRN